MHFSLLKHTKQVLLVTFCGMFVPYFNKTSSVLPCLMDPRDLRVTQNAYFSLLTKTKHLLLVILCDLTAGIGASF